MIDVENAIKIAVKTGTVSLGSKESIRLVKNEQAKLIMVSSNCPAEILDDLKTYCKFSNLSIYQYKGSNWDLGFICGKPFMVSVLAIIEPGDSDILKLTEESAS